MIKCFEVTMKFLVDAVNSIKEEEFIALLDECEKTLRNGRRIIASGLGKNVPVCEKFEGTMLSLGLNCHFMHTNTAIHGDLGMVRDGDLVLILTKSGSTAESILLHEQLKKRQCTIWLLTFCRNSALYSEIPRHLAIRIEHEGDPWNILPNNSSTVNLIVLQELAMQLALRLGVTLVEFKKNHPGGDIGKTLSVL